MGAYRQVGTAYGLPALSEAATERVRKPTAWREHGAVLTLRPQVPYATAHGSSPAMCDFAPPILRNRIK